MLAQRQPVALTRLGDHLPRQNLIEGFGVTIDPISEALKFDIVPVLCVNTLLGLGTVAICGVMGGPFAVAGVLVSGGAWLAITANSFLVCVRGGGLEELPAAAPPVGQDCFGCKFADRDTGVCVYWQQDVAPDDWCENWDNTIDLMPEPEVVRSLPPAPTAIPEISPTATRAEAIALEEISLSSLWSRPAAEEPLSPDLERIHQYLQGQARQGGFNLRSESPEMARDFDVLADLRSIHYSLLGEVLTVRHV